jgi:hypothetical protein
MAELLLSEVLTHGTQQLNCKYETYFFDSWICVSLRIRQHLLAQWLKKENLDTIWICKEMVSWLFHTIQIYKIIRGVLGEFLVGVIIFF